MTQPLPPRSSSHPPADRCCDRPPCFQARLEAAAGSRPVISNTQVCADHLGDAVQALTTWARQQGLHGQLTVLATGQPGSRRPAGCGAGPAAGLPDGFAFSIIRIGPS
jgi:hypothetical protein